MQQTPLIEEIPYCDPLEVFGIIPKEGAIFLDSAAPAHPQSKYSFIAFSPFKIFTAKNEPNPFEYLRSELKKYTLERVEGLPPFQGGVAGVLGYELGGYLEKLPRSPRDDLEFPEILIGFYDLVIAWDHSLQKTWIFSSGFPQPDSERLLYARHRIQYTKDLISHAKEITIPAMTIPEEDIISTFNSESYQNAVRKVIEYIRAGDIFEVNISQRFSASLPEDITPFELYCRLRRNNPAPFSAFMQYKAHAVASASPERFLKLTNTKVEARPIKGTRPRDKDHSKDQLLAEELMASAKDRAENIMIVDLMRNDLSRVCLPHSVKVPQLCGLESFTTVHHLVSIVEGEMQPGLGALELLQATFPGGSITGAPKIRSMEIIAELEPTLRGPYCGSIGYIGFNGDLDLSITIRTFAINNRMVTFQAGGAITVDSDPLQEYDETLAKARALRRTLIQP